MQRKIRDVMTADVRVLSPNDTVEEAAIRMKDLNIGALPVCDGDTLMGMVTDRDMVLRCVATGDSPNATSVREIMSSPIIFCFEDQDIEDVARLMEVRQIRRLVVLGADRQLVGIVSLGDIAVKTGKDYLSGEILEKVSTPVQEDSLRH